jgi:shikimate dehydrogenase
VASLDILAVYQFNIIARDRGKGGRLVEPYGEYGRVYGFDQAAEALRNGAALINASPLGMEGFDPMPESVLAGLGGLASDAFVMDMVYVPVRTDLLRQAAQHGLRTVDGLTMLIAQARESFRYFFGMPAPLGHDSELRELLTR